MSHSKLEKISQKTRKLILQMIYQSQSGHPGGSLGMTDIFTTLYFEILRHNPKQPNWPDRDKLILSNGHICPVLYATLAQASYFDEKELMTFRHTDSRLQGHPHYGSLPGVENTSGSLGQGLSVASGLAYSHKLDNRPNRVYAVLSDGEHQEGQTWEAYMFAGINRLDNLTILIDRNNMQIEGKTTDVMDLESLSEKLQSFNVHVIEIDGHNFDQIISACLQAQEIQNKPTAIICHTIPGKGVDFMENNYKWHGKAPNKKQMEVAINQL